MRKLVMLCIIFLVPLSLAAQEGKGLVAYKTEVPCGGSDDPLGSGGSTPPVTYCDTQPVYCYPGNGGACCDFGCPDDCCDDLFSCCGTFSGFVELLVWEAREEGLDFAATIPPGNLPAVIPFAPSQEVFAVDESKFDAGVRLGVVYNFPCPSDALDLQLYWTHFNTKQSNSAQAASIASAFIVPLFVNDFGEPIANNADASWKLDYNIADIEVGYAMNFDPCRIVFRPHLGVRGAWIHQKLNVDYNQLLFQAASTAGSGNFTSYNKNNFRAFGLRYGADTAWNFCNNWCIFGKGGSSLLWGNWDVNQKVVLNAPAVFNGVLVPAGTEVSSQTSERHQLAAELDLSAGIAWNRLCECLWNMDLTLSLAWEFQIWFSQNQMLNTVGPDGFRYVNLNGDLYLQGLTFRADISF